MNIGWLLFSFKGRIGRLAYFGLTIAYLIVFGVIGAIVDAKFGSARPVRFEDIKTASAALQQFNVYLLPIHLLYWWIGCAIATKRLHDIGKSGWLNLYFALSLFVAVIIAGFGVAFKNHIVTLVGGGALLVWTVYVLWWTFVLFFRAGDEGSNDYGAPSAGPEDDAPEPRTVVARAARAHVSGAAPAGFGRR